MTLRLSRGLLFALVLLLAGCAREQGAEAQGGRTNGMPYADPQQQMLDSLNAERRASGLAPLRLDAELEAVVQGYTDEITSSGRPLAGDPARVVMDRLEKEGYRAFRLVAGYAQAEGDFAGVLRQWRSGDLKTFRSLAAEEVSDFALGVGDIRGQPFYLAVGAVKRADHYGGIGDSLAADHERARQEILTTINQARRKAGRSPLTRSGMLDDIAQDYADDMLRRGYYGHYSPEGRDVMDRVQSAGYRPRKVGENVASGQTSAEQVARGWLNSPAHYENIADREFRETGIGLASGMGDDGEYHFLWVQVFAQPMADFRGR